MPSTTVVLAGPTGMIGGRINHQLLNDVGVAVVVSVRKAA